MSSAVHPLALKLAEARRDKRTLVMAILNLTPDSFSDGGLYESDPEAVLEMVDEWVALGVDVVDVGGESTRPGAEAVPIETEQTRVVPIIRLIRKRHPGLLISVDTRKAQVAASALSAGACIINDVSGLQFHDTMATVAAQFQAGLIIMHSQGTPETMQVSPQYTHVTHDVMHFLSQQANKAIQARVPRELLLVDPGFGFGKNQTHNLILMQQLSALKSLGLPIAVGLSRKSFMTLGHDTPPHERDTLTAASITLAIQAGADLVRIHNVEALLPVVRLVDQIVRH